MSIICHHLNIRRRCFPAFRPAISCAGLNPGSPTLHELPPPSPSILRFLQMANNTLLLFLLSSLVYLATAIPLSRRDVYDPPVTSPASTTVWSVGETVVVTWDNTLLPPDSRLTRLTARLVLGFDDGVSSNLMYNTPLADGFKIRDGTVKITVPDVPSRTNYIVVLMGTSGNKSQKFTITGGAVASPSSSSSLITEPIPITGPGLSTVGTTSGLTSTTATTTPLTTSVFTTPISTPEVSSTTVVLSSTTIANTLPSSLPTSAATSRPPTSSVSPSASSLSSTSAPSNGARSTAVWTGLSSAILAVALVNALL